MKNKIPLKEIPTVPAEEWDRIVQESAASNELLNHPKFTFFINYLKRMQESIILLIATNQVKDIVETFNDPDTNTSKSIKTTKEEQLNELSGQHKLVTKILTDLQSLSGQASEYLKLQEQKKLIIGVSKEKDSGTTL